MYEELVKSLRSIDEYDTGYAKLIYDAADAIEDLQEKLDDARMDASEWAESLEYMSAAKVKLEEQTRWIPVTERLPEKDGYNLCWLTYTVYPGPGPGETRACRDVVYFDIKSKHWFLGYSHPGRSKVLAWMPLPEPPKEE